MPTHANWKKFCKSNHLVQSCWPRPLFQKSTVRDGRAGDRCQCEPRPPPSARKKRSTLDSICSYRVNSAVVFSYFPQIDLHEVETKGFCSRNFFFHNQEAWVIDCGQGLWTGTTLSVRIKTRTRRIIRQDEQPLVVSLELHTTLDYSSKMNNEYLAKLVQTNNASSLLR